MSPKTNALAGSGIPARGHSKTDRGRRKVDPALSYGPLLRLADNVDGAADARRAPDAAIAGLPWVRRMEATLAENSRRILVGTRDVVAPELRAIVAGRAKIAELERLLTDTEARLDQVRAPEHHAGHGEVHLPAEAIADRSERVAQAARAELRSQINGLRTRRDGVRAELAQATAVVEEEFGMAVAITRRMYDFYRRRLNTYLRRFLKRREDLTSLGHDLVLPDWVEQPCTWLDPAPAPEALARLHAIH